MVPKVCNSVDKNTVVLVDKATISTTTGGVNKKQQQQQQLLHCDYLVVRAGIVGMSFVDTLITENPAATIILIDWKSQAGDHWTQAYPFVKLHQPSFYYDPGVDALPLGKTFISKHGTVKKERYNIHDDRMTSGDILEYYQKACDQFVATGRVKCIFNCEYKKFDENTGLHTIIMSSPSGTTTADNENLFNNNNKDNVVFAVNLAHGKPFY